MIEDKVTTNCDHGLLKADFAFEQTGCLQHLAHRDSTKQKAHRSGNLVNPILRLSNLDGIDSLVGCSKSI